jgi:ABC-2 type transport system ATP-binding protein
MPSSNLIIQIDSLVRVFKNTIAVDGINLEIQSGELYGLIGPDGAGKTTTLRLLAGLLDITSGKATLSGFDLARDPEKVKPIIGYMAQQFSLYAKLSVLENLIFFAEIYNVNRNELKKRADRLLKFAGLEAFQDRKAEHLSGGMQKKLALACTLIHDPPILLLDEPTTGVDPVSRREFWRILNNLHINGTTIIISTPYMDEADRCSKVGLMHNGKLIVSDTPRNIRSLVKGELIKFIVDDWQTARNTLGEQPGVFEVQTYGEALNVLVDSAKKRLPKLKKILARNGLVCISAQPVAIRMEEAFISLIRHLEV